QYLADNFSRKHFFLILSCCFIYHKKTCTRGHETIAKQNPNACRACHGLNGEGSVLSRAATDRSLPAKEDNDPRILLNKGDMVTCTLCHKNEL
ncbi:MAG: hypothetical protein KZQ74_03670, partial [gamma proteobacterium symbiont of Bathyaustriella thionipta]|nr:hypothetical protein [gamma proteobacterium symbiont of Bathyaustriella thionipta]MCU7951682.1 hypothetical protein [gamma proteobacterium symbiont of Bathyaustriella thionipta]MCU7958280.1 hypothetical protein [gamma proteobacterium symbiont of Bathyaustriella thionipta]MCU7966286.1 hypothetical protein [gamma proteobacterium symbiont of Bathyaustriella thionipta]